MNKKGMTLTEIIISVALISIVLIFMVRILTSLRYDETDTTYNKSNSVSRTEITRVIQSDLQAKGILKIEDISSEPNTAKIKITFSDNDIKYLIVNSDKSTLEYCTNVTCEDQETLSRWEINDEEKRFYYSSCIELNYHLNQNSNVDYYYFKLIIPVATNYYNNPKDDIELYYLGKKFTDMQAAFPNPNRETDDKITVYLGKDKNGNDCTNESIN